MFASTRLLGSTDQGTSFADIITNNVAAVSENQVSGFEGFIHDPKLLKETVEYIGKMDVPQRFIEAVTARRVATATINATWRCPLNLQTPLTCPVPWVLIESSQRMTTGNKIEYQLMRTADFIGRNYIRIELPEVDTTEVSEFKFTELGQPDPTKIYLGAWHRDLIPRIISEVEFYPRSSQHRLFTYTGYDIAVHNIIFGNHNKEMNDLMAGEDRFELAYDPYRVDGTALGVASFKGMDFTSKYQDAVFCDATGEPFDVSQFGEGQTYEKKVAKSLNHTMKSLFGPQQVGIRFNKSTDSGKDGFVDLFQLDTTMDKDEFLNFYRKNVWYEAPVAVPYDCRHSIHSRRFYHRKTVIIVPLDVLPFGYSIEASLPASALAGDCGYISIQKFSDWFDRAFYLTKLSHIPSSHPLVQHRHYDTGDITVQVGAALTGSVNVPRKEAQVYNHIGDKFSMSITEQGEDPNKTYVHTSAGDPRHGWVNPRSVGRFGDMEFMTEEVGWQLTGGRGAGEAIDEDAQNIQLRRLPTEEYTNKYPEQVINGVDGLEGVVPTLYEPHDVPGDDGNIKDYQHTQQVRSGYGYKATQAPITKFYQGGNANLYNTSKIDKVKVKGSNEEEAFLQTPSVVSKSWAATKSQEISFKLIQTGYVVLQCLKQLLTKLPNIYITTEWSDYDIDINSSEFKINNDLYIMAILLWFLPKDSNGIESMRVYPHHKKDTEYPLCAGIFMQNEASQGKNLMSWDMMNLVEPAHMGLSPLLSNMGIISFTPLMKPNTLPYGVYDQNLSGYLIGKFEKGDGQDVYPGYVNMRDGVVKAISIGINGVANVNLTLFRLIF